MSLLVVQELYALYQQWMQQDDEENQESIIIDVDVDDENIATATATVDSISSGSANASIDSIQDGINDDEQATSITELILGIGLFFLMIGVGASCKPSVMKKVFLSRNAFQASLVGITCQFLIMPLMSYILTLVFNIRGYTALGCVLAGSVPGTGGSNIYTIWCFGILELSVFMTLISTIVAFGVTPFWLWLFSKHLIQGLNDDEDDSDNGPELALDQIFITFLMLIIPLSIGFSFNFISCMNQPRIRKFMERTLNIVAIIFFIGAITSLIITYPNAFSKQYANKGVRIAAIIYFPLCVGTTYLITSRLLKLQPAICRTIVSEVGLQNLALAFVIGERSVKTRIQRDQTLPFPFIYVISMYVLSGLILVPYFRYQKHYNTERQITDFNELEFFSTRRQHQPHHQHEVEQGHTETHHDDDDDDHNNDGKDDDEKESDNSGNSHRKDTEETVISSV